MGSEDDFWFGPLNPETFEFVSDHSVGRHRHDRARKDFREWVNRIGLPYYSPHKFRHGFATYAISQAVTVADLKAISQNLMHSNLNVTDAVYSQNELSERIENLVGNNPESDQEIIRQLESILQMLKN